MPAEGGSSRGAGELLSLAREIRALVGKQYAGAQAGDYACVAAVGEDLSRLFRRWEAAVAKAAGENDPGHHLSGPVAAGGAIPAQAAALLREALELNGQVAAILEAGLAGMRAEQQNLANSRQAQQAYAAALRPWPPIINTRR
ncbi:MAG: hypothetical protein D9V47_14885 [Clostridia bacterium]|nr:MAG: hypothetical protein D9V47_14885 [Clostridia bacterium]